MSEMRNHVHAEHRLVGSLARATPAIAALLILVAGFVLGLAELWPQLHRQWTAVDHYEHGYLMLGMAAWLAWRSWRAYPPFTLTPSWSWLLPFAVVLLILLLMELVFLDVPRLYTLPLLVVASCGLVFGREAGKRILWPAIFLYFALPVWVWLTGHLQALTTAVNAFLLGLASIPVYIEGNYVHLPAGTFRIAEGCSGLKFLIVGMSLGAFYGLALLRSWRARIQLFAIAVAVTLLSNGLRVFIIIVAGHLTDMQHYLVAESHSAFGWWLFAAMLSLVLLSASWLEHTGRPAAAARADASQERGGPEMPSRPLPMLAAAVLCAGLLLVPAAFHTVGSGGAQEFRGLPIETLQGNPRQAPALGWQPVFRGGHIDRVAYLAGDRTIDVFRAMYAQQGRESRVIRYGHTFTGSTWRPIGRGIRTVALGDKSYQVIEYQGYVSGQHALIWAWYEVGGRQATSNLGVKLLEVRAVLRGRRDAAAVAIASPCVPNCESAAADMEDFLRANAAWLFWPLSGSNAP